VSARTIRQPPITAESEKRYSAGLSFQVTIWLARPPVRRPLIKIGSSPHLGAGAQSRLFCAEEERVAIAQCGETQAPARARVSQTSDRLGKARYRQEITVGVADASCSLLTVMKSGEQIETAIVGTEGVGGWVALDGANANTQSTVQIEGSGWELPTAKFLEVYKTSYALRSAINKYQAIILFQAQQSAACHALHSVESRLCRWLLQSQDMIGSGQIVLTQEFLSHMLGVHHRCRCAHTRCGLDSILAWQNKNPQPQWSRRNRLRMLLRHSQTH
jgi:hypothetical protein